MKKIEEFDKSANKLGNNKSMSSNNILTGNNNINNMFNNNNENINNNSSFEANNDFIPNKKLSNKNIRSRNENKSKLTASVSADNVLMTPIEEINLSDKDDIINTVTLSIGENIVNSFESKKWQEKEYKCYV